MPLTDEDIGGNEQIFSDPQAMHASICKHVEETRHVVISADDAKRRLIGFKCGCRLWWATPVQAVRSASVPYMAEATRTFAAKQRWAAVINEARRKTAWEHLNEAGDDE
jgi:hypothetical protein